LGSDGGAEAAEVMKNNATMILREGGSILVAKITTASAKLADAARVARTV
jgi:hypothetical protein